MCKLLLPPLTELGKSTMITLHNQITYTIDGKGIIISIPAEGLTSDECGKLFHYAENSVPLIIDIIPNHVDMFEQEKK